MYDDCPRRTAAKLFGLLLRTYGFDDIRPENRSIGAVVGTATHAGAAHYYRARLAGQAMPQEQVDEAAMASLDEEAAGGAVMHDDISPNRDTAQKQVIRQLAVYRRMIADNVVPTSVEERLEAVLPSGVILSGQKDLVTEEGGRMRDLKTGRLRRTNIAQYGAYSTLERSNRRGIFSKLTEDYVPRAPLSKVQPPPLIVNYDVALAENIARDIINRAEKAVLLFEETGDPQAFPANPASQLCSRKFCPAYKTSFCPISQLKME